MKFSNFSCLFYMFYQSSIFSVFEGQLFHENVLFRKSFFKLNLLTSLKRRKLVQYGLKRIITQMPSVQSQHLDPVLKKHFEMAAQNILFTYVQYMSLTFFFFLSTFDKDDTQITRLYTENFVPIHSRDLGLLIYHALKGLVGKGS